MKPLQDVTVLDLSQFLSGPAAAMRLADLGARVIKIERTGTGDLGRQLTLSNLKVDGDSTVFHCMNRNKESFAADLKNPEDLNNVKQLIARADVLIENFRPGTMERLGLSWSALSELNPRLIYARVTGYGKEGPWARKPGQDLLVQAVSGLGWLNGKQNGKPVPFGLSIVDMFASAHLAQGILALLAKRTRTNIGGVVEVSLLETALDLQFEGLTTYFNDGGKLPDRGKQNNAHAYLGAPYGIYETKDGYVALAMGSIEELGKLIQCTELTTTYADPASWFEKRDEIKAIIERTLQIKTTEHWLKALDAGGFWCAPVLNMKEFVDSDGFQALSIVQELVRPNGTRLRTTRCPIRIDGDLLASSKWAPTLGEDTDKILQELAEKDVRPSAITSFPHFKNTSLPLKGVLVVDFTQFLSGPSATLRLADLGANVIKIERADVGDISRKLYISDVNVDGDSTLFHAANRNKQSVSVNLKNDEDLVLVKELIKKADVVVQNFRPGVIERLGLGYEDVKKLNPRIIYGSITGYGSTGPWKDKPGQDLLVQSMAGLPWLNGDGDDPPVPFGLSVVDMMSGAHLLQGLLACIVRRNVTGKGGMVEVSLMESVIDLQFEVLTAFLNDGGQIPKRSSVNNANAYLSAPYGFYRTQDGYVALAMGSVSTIADLIDCTALKGFQDENQWFYQRDEIKTTLENHLRTQPSRYWLDILEKNDIWCAEVLDWNSLSQHEAFKNLFMIQTTRRENGTIVQTTRCPFRINENIFTSEVGSPRLGEHNLQFVKSLTGML